MTSENTVPADKITLSIVIPAYNESRRLGGTLARIRHYASETGQHYEVIVVDDGSGDGTAELVRAGTWEPLSVRLLVNDRNRGKGYSVRRGMLAARGELLLMCDADLSAPLEELAKLMPWIAADASSGDRGTRRSDATDRTTDAGGFDIVMGSRDLPDSLLDPPQPLRRRLMAWAFRAMRRRLLLPEIRDTQCGFKLFRRAAARDVFERQTIDGWLFDCEVLALADRLGYRIREVGITWRNHPDSRVRALREAFRSIPSLLTIRRRLRHVRREM